MATLEFLTLTITLPAISLITVTVPPTTNPRLSRNFFISALPLIFLMSLSYPSFTMVKGIAIPPLPMDNA